MYKDIKAVVCDFCCDAALPDIVYDLNNQVCYNAPPGWKENEQKTVHVCPDCLRQFGHERGSLD